MYNKFIKLKEQYSKTNKRDIWVNPSKIVSMHIWNSEDGPLTRIRFSEDITKSIDVTDSPQDIIAFLEASNV